MQGGGQGGGETCKVGERSGAEEGGSVAVPTSEVGLRGEGAESGTGREEGGPAEGDGAREVGESRALGMRGAV